MAKKHGDTEGGEDESRFDRPHERGLEREPRLASTLLTDR